MLRDLFVNISILISFIFLGFIFFKDTPVNHKSSVKIRYTAGIIGGVLGVILMTLNIQPSVNSLVDLRFIPVIIVAIYAGTFPAIVTAVIIALFRILLFKVNFSTILAVTAIMLSAVGNGAISKLTARLWEKWSAMCLFSVMLFTIKLGITLKGSDQLYNTVLEFWITSILASLAIYHVIKYAEETYVIFTKFKEQSTKDFLTGLSNSREFNLLFDNLTDRVGKDIDRFSILIIDIDYFKRINDSYGHPAGDAVLKQLAVVLSNVCSPDDVISRIGGEEFAILLPDSNYMKASWVAERIRMAIKRHKFLLQNGLEVSCTVSIGVATYPDTVTDANRLISKADQALYKAKEMGRNRVFCIGDNCNLIQHGEITK
ncbi:diguanylate cyclase [Clostridium sp. A1-XYC3]|uniref:Diguanylate cyclase n=1 Tax=Clostridium tanneri TaxID=3037988 RepID=A0ABU4JSA4_9CLOT|nr:diguanylate cyclase [Clostridium sp. A1-XYC3]MDW8800841.1 diguanylate cyclase [Clostridium sp. A1-XYC3]